MFYVIDDPHREHRNRALAQLEQAELEDASVILTTAGPTTPSPALLEPQQSLPESHEALAIFVLSNGAKLNDYHWFGLVGICESERAAVALDYRIS